MCNSYLQVHKSVLYIIMLQLADTCSRASGGCISIHAVSWTRNLSIHFGDEYPAWGAWTDPIWYPGCQRVAPFSVYLVLLSLHAPHTNNACVRSGNEGNCFLESLQRLRSIDRLCSPMRPVWMNAPWTVQAPQVKWAFPLFVEVETTREEESYTSQHCIFYQRQHRVR